MTDKTKSGPLAGIRIVEFAGLGPGPFAAMLLADMGADIIRLDRPGGNMASDDKVVNRSRPCAVVDLKDPGQKAKVMTLLESADALIEGFRPGVMERLGFGPDEILKRNPRLVYGRMTGWGQEGPLAHAAGHDINYIALAGALAGIGTKDRTIPPLNLVGDYGGGGLYLAMGILAAIISAQKTGEGQVVDAAICDGTASLMAMFTDWMAKGHWQEKRESNVLDGGAHFYRTYVCADGEHISVGAIEPQFYAELRDKAELSDDAFDEQLDAASWPALTAKMEAIFRTKTREEWCAILEGTDACFAPVLTVSEAAKHPHMASREVYVDIGGITQPAPAPRFSATPVKAEPPSTIDLDSAVSLWSGS